jgi:putative Ca2+/H+ antiporter (TMEM165/GDT1 family)
VDAKLLLTVFVTVLLAEMGDKTQLATMLFAAREPAALLAVFLAATAALVCATGIGVAAGAALGQFVEPKVLGVLAGIGFVLVGLWTIRSALAA